MCACVRIHVQAYIVHQTLHSFHLKIVLCSFFIDFFFGFFFASQNDIDYKENCHNSYSFIKMIYSLFYKFKKIRSEVTRQNPPNLVALEFLTIETYRFRHEASKFDVQIWVPHLLRKFIHLGPLGPRVSLN